LNQITQTDSGVIGLEINSSIDTRKLWLVSVLMIQISMKQLRQSIFTVHNMTEVRSSMYSISVKVMQKTEIC